MRKVKTIIASLFIAMASVLLGACSCGETEVAHINESDINIRFVSGSTQHVLWTKDEDSGILNISCHVGESFKIEYTLSPENTTRTQVNWSFTGDTSAVTPEKNEWQRIKSTVETVTFYAKNTTQSADGTKLVFKTAYVGMEAVAYIKVAPPITDLPVLGAPEYVEFDTNDNAIEWGPITTAYKKGVELDDSEIELVEGQVKGWYAYRLVIEDLDATSDDKRFKTIDDTFKDRKYSITADDVVDESGNIVDEGFFRAGGRYSVTVAGLADNFYAVSGDSSDPYIFSKLALANNVENKNGNFSYNLPNYAATSELIYSSRGTSKVYATGNTNSVKLTDLKESSNETIYTYPLSIVCYPSEFDIERYKNNKNDKSTHYVAITDTNLNKKINYFPSDATSPYTVERLKNPNIKLEESKGAETIGGVEFGSGANSIYTGSVISLVGSDKYAEEYGAKFQYEIKGENGTVNGTINSTTERLPFSSLTGNTFDVTIQRVGNVSNTIESEKVTLKVNRLSTNSNLFLLNSKKLDASTTETDYNKFNCYSYNDWRMTGVEYYIVGKSDPNYSYTFLSEFRLQEGWTTVSYDLTSLVNSSSANQLPKLPNGSYDVYVRLLGFYGADGSGSYINLTSPATKVITDMIVAPSPTGYKIDKDGTLSFNKVGGYTDYNVSITYVDKENKTKIDSRTINTNNNPKYIFNVFDEIAEEFSTTARDILNSDNPITIKLKTVGTGNVNTIDSQSLLVEASVLQTPEAEGIVYDNKNEEYTLRLGGKQGENKELISDNYNVKVEVYKITAGSPNTEELIDSSYSKTRQAANNEGIAEIGLGADFTTLVNTLSSQLKSTDSQYLQYRFIVSAEGSTISVNNKGVLNSHNLVVNYDVVKNTPEIVGVDDNGVLSWKTSNITNTNQTGIFRIILTVDGNVVEIPAELTSKTLSSGGVGFTLDIQKELNNLKGNVVSITIKECSANKIAGSECNAVYATILEAPILDRDNSYNITWNTIANANKYSISIDKINKNTATVAEEPPAGDDPSTDGGDNLPQEPTEPTYPITEDIVKTTSSYSLRTLLSSENGKLIRGACTISLIAVGDTTTEGLGETADKPFVISSVASEMKINFVDFATTQLKVTTNEDYTITLDWNDVVNTREWLEILNGGVIPKDNIKKSSIQYVLEGGDVISDSVINALTFTTETFYKTGDVSVILKPIISFEESGVIFITDSPSLSCALNKLSLPSVIKTENGRLVVTGPQGCDIALYLGGTAKTNKIDRTKYSFDEVSGVYTFTLGSEVQEGANDIYVRLSKSGLYIDSNISEKYTATKLTSVTLSRQELKLNISQPPVGEGEATISEKVLQFISWTDISNASSYTLKYQMPGKQQYSITIFNRVKGTDDADGIYITALDGTAYPDTLKFIVKDGVCYFLLDEGELFGNDVGDINIEVIANTNVAGYLNSNSSKQLTLTKLNASLAFANADGDIEIAPYVKEGNHSPTQVIITIREVGSSEAKDETRYKKLDTDGVTTIDCASLVIIREYSDNASYVIDFDTECGDLAKLDGATFDISVQFVGYYEYNTDGQTITYTINNSNIVEGEVVTVAINRTLQSVLGTVEGVLTLSNVASDTTKVLVTITDDDSGIDYNYYIFKKPTDGKIAIEESDLVNEIKDEDSSTTIQEELDNEGSTGDDNDSGTGEDSVVSFKFIAGTNYSVKVVTIDKDGISSIISDTFKVKKLKTPEAVKVIGSQTPYLQWSNTNYFGNEYQYDIDYQDGMGIITTDKIAHINASTGAYLPKITYALSIDKTANEGRQIYDLILRVKGNSTISDSSGSDDSQSSVQTTTATNNIGYLNSDYSAVCPIIYINQPTITAVNNASITWTSIEGAYGYTVTIDGRNVSITAKTITSTNDDGSETVTQATTQSINIADYAIFDNLTGVQSITVTANIDAKDGIISSDEFTGNQLSFYRPTLVSSSAIQNGQYFWKIKLSSIEGYLTYLKTLATTAGNEELTNVSNVELYDVVKYVINKLDGKLTPPEGGKLEGEYQEILTNIVNENYFSFLITNTLKYNVEALNGQGVQTNITASISPSKAKLVGIQNTEVEYDSTSIDSQYLGFYFDVPYSAGRYDLQVLNNGWANLACGVAVVNTRYTSQLTNVYKPSTPVTYVSEVEGKVGEDGNPVIEYVDIINGKLSWLLSTTNSSNPGEFEFVYNYQIQATPYSDKEAKIVTVSTTIDPTEDTNANNHVVGRHVKQFIDTDNGLFTINGDINSVVNRVRANTYYTLKLRSEGNNDRLLNSDYTNINEMMNLLDYAHEMEVKGGQYQWEQINGAEKAELYIYGNYRNTVDRDVVYNQTETMTVQEYNPTWWNFGFANQLSDEKYNETTQPLGYNKMVTLDSTINTYILDDQFSAGGYFIRNKQIGNGRGVIDSEISPADISEEAVTGKKIVVASKLGATSQPTSTTTWIGNANTLRFKYIENETVDGTVTNGHWHVDASETVQYINNGVFVWNPVAVANAYEIKVYQKTPDETNFDIEEVPVWSDRVTVCRYDLPKAIDGMGKEKLPAYYMEGTDKIYYEYIIEIVAVRANITNDVVDITADGKTSLQDGYFVGDSIYTTDEEKTIGYTRLDPIEGILVNGSGEVSWDGSQSFDTRVLDHRLKVNLSASEDETHTNIEVGTSSEGGRPYFTISDENLPASGPAYIQVKRISNDKNVLNSTYSDSLNIWRLNSPQPKVQDGIFMWGSSEAITGSILDEIVGSDSTNILDNANVMAFKYYTELDQTNYMTYSSSEDEENYPEGEHTFSVRFAGSEGTSADSGAPQPFKIGSKPALADNLYKLPTPEIEYVEQSNDETSYNYIRWSEPTTLQGVKEYRVKLFLKVVTITENPEAEGGYETIENIIPHIVVGNVGDDSGYFFSLVEDESRYIYINITSILKDVEGFSFANGGILNVFVQRIGDTSEDETKEKWYLSSSYSERKQISIPATPTFGEYNGDTGILTWSVNDGIYNIKLITDYVVTLNNEDMGMLNSYWLPTAEMSATGQNSVLSTNANYDASVERHDEIIKRTINYDSIWDESSTNVIGYTLYVTDTIWLKATDEEYKVNNVPTTPTSYQLTSIAEKYIFYIIAMANDNPEEQDNSLFSSAVKEVIGNNGEGYSFVKFAKGVGLDSNPYVVESAEQFSTINNFADKSFKLDADGNTITLDNTKTWSPITNFTGRIDGNGHTLSGLVFNTSYNEASLIINNNGVVENLTISAPQFSSENGNGTTLEGLKVATVAINNMGTISNINVVNSAYYARCTNVSADDELTLVAGIAITNGGIISNCNVTGTMLGYDSSSNATRVAGIAIYNGYLQQVENQIFEDVVGGTIDWCTFDGDLYGNYVAGIANYNYKTISNCSVGENATLNAVDQDPFSNTTRGVSVAGIANYIEVYNSDVAIVNSYSLAKINVTKVTESNASVSGFVGYINWPTRNSEQSNKHVILKNNYVVVNVAVITGNTGSSGVVAPTNITINAGHNTLDSGEDRVEISNNYWTNNSDTSVTIIPTMEGNGWTKSDSMETLKNELDKLVDHSSNKIYNVTGNYPVLIKN